MPTVNVNGTLVTVPLTTLDLTPFLSKNNGLTLTGANFGSTNPADIVPMPVLGGHGPMGSRWDQNTAGAAWMGPTGPALNYSITAVDNKNQVITVTVGDAVTGTVVATIYGQILSYSSDAFSIAGFTHYDAATDTLTHPLTSAPNGDSDFFTVSSDMLDIFSRPRDSSWTDQAYDKTAAFAPFGTTLLGASCFAEGTLIATPAGSVAVELLAPGDTVLTASGVGAVVQWVGRRRVACEGLAQPARFRPVCIAAGAFGAHIPARDLMLSPEHAVFHDGVLVPIHRLVNGSTIRQEPAADITYYHIVLPQHGVVLAEGLPAETYRETGNAFVARTAASQAA